MFNVHDEHIFKVNERSGSMVQSVFQAFVCRRSVQTCKYACVHIKLKVGQLHRAVSL